MKSTKTGQSILVGLLCCPDNYCDGAVRIQAHDIGKGADKMEQNIQTVIDRLEAWAETEERLMITATCGLKDTEESAENDYCNRATNYRELVRLLKGEPPLKTHQQWQDSATDLSVFLQVGDAVDDTMRDYFIETLPPACMSGKCIQIGEAFTHTDAGEPEFMTLEKQDGRWVYTGVKPTPETEKCLYAE